MPNKFTEHDTEAFYDAEDALYRSFWDQEGSLHWGIFDESTGWDFLKACGNLNSTMVETAHNDKDSHVLDMGCGNGATADQHMVEAINCGELGWGMNHCKK